MTPHVVIVGGGFGGLTAARTLKDQPVRITLIDRYNHHLFQPLLYQVATGALSPAEIAQPIRAILRHQPNATVVLREVVGIDLAGRKVTTKGPPIEYDYLILAAGARHAYFGHPEWEEIAPGLKDMRDALEIRDRVLHALERADRETDPAAKRALLTFVVIGAGPTGVEMAGAIAEIGRHQVSPDFRHIDPAEIRVLIVEAAPRVLTAFPEELSEKARTALHHLGVEVQHGMVTSLEPGRVVLKDGEIHAATILWAAGVAAAPITKSLGVPVDNAGRVIVNKDLTMPGFPNAMAIGDVACFMQDGKLVPGVAPAAMQMGPFSARNVVRAIRGEALLDFHYNDKGNLATIGRASAVADFGKFRLSGFMAWMAWMVIHIFFLIGFRNRFVAIFNWIWTYFTYNRASMLIVGKERD